MKQFFTNWIRLSGLLAFLAVAQPLYAQDITLTGKIISSKDNLPLPGVTVGVNGSTQRVSTDANGVFRIPVAGRGNTLSFTYVGFKTKEVPQPSSGTVLDVTLDEDQTNLNEVVVIGYGSQRKSDVTGAVAVVDKKRLESLPNTNFAQALQAAVPGISVDQNNGGAEGNNNTIRIRGRSSITASTTPLIVLDGVPYSGSISEINPSDIDNISVLKDASAAGIYGSRAANGVILITSKKGTRGKTTISYDGMYGIQNIANLPPLLSPEEFYQYKITREPGSISTSEQAVYDSKNFPDWVNLATQQGDRMQHTLGVSGGSENTRFYVSGTYLNVKGVAVNDEFNRNSARINVESNVRKWLTLSTNNQLLYINRAGLPATFADYTGAYRLNPLTVAYNADGTPTIYPWTQDTFFPNPLAPTLANNKDDSYKVVTNNYLNLDVPFVKGLSYRLNTGVEYTTRGQKTYYGTNTRTGALAKGDLNTTDTKNTNIVLENIVNYQRVFGKHSVFFTGLYGYQRIADESAVINANGFPNDVLTYYQANVASLVQPTANDSKAITISQMARLNYAFNSKYLITLTARRDGYSGFGKNNKYSFFPIVAAGWNISDEKFLANSKIITNLKLRASYGDNGTQAIAAYRTLARLTTRSYVDQSTTLPGYIPSVLATPDLKWETTRAANIGLDFGLFDGRVQGSFEVYNKKTRDLLLQRAISSVHGTNSILQNIGKTANKGVDIGLNTTNIRSDKFNWNSTVSFSLNRNKIVDLYGNGLNDTANVWFIGKPIDVNFGYKYAGVWQTTDDFTKAPTGTKPGYAKVEDLNGDGKITANADRTIIGSRQPDFSYGVGNTFTYRKFSLYAFIQGVAGTSRRNSIYSDDVQNLVRNNTFKKNWWTPTNPTNDYYANALNVNPFNVGIYESDSYARLKDLSLAYEVPATFLRQVKLNRVKLYVTGRNLVTVTKWNGMDPELNSQEDIPLQKEFVFGLNIGL